MKNKIFFLLLYILFSLAYTNNLNNMTKIDKKSPIVYEQEIMKIFEKQYRYYVDKMRKSLKKDPNGLSDTYVLYNLQMHMQNTIIYADENNNTKIINKLLDLVLVPFEKQYLTNNEWLNGTHGIVGKESILVITQYFSLLTRVLSAAKRHHVKVNLNSSQIKVIIEHINKWIKIKPYRNIIADRELFCVQSIMQFYDYAKRENLEIPNLRKWKNFVQDYYYNSFSTRWKQVACLSGDAPKEAKCLILSEPALTKKDSYKYAGYGSDIVRESSDINPKAMFNAKGWAKQMPKLVKDIGQDISHARRINWFLETVKRFGKDFKISISEEKLQGWANNLAYRVCRGDKNDPHFTIFSDGTDGWFRVNYSHRPHFGYTLGDMDIHFVASSYGIFGVYNFKIYLWMSSWAKVHWKKLKSNDGYLLDYYTSLSIDIRKEIF